MILGGQTSVFIPVVFRKTSHVIEGRTVQKDFSKGLSNARREIFPDNLNFKLFIPFFLSESVSASINSNCKPKFFSSEKKYFPEN